MNNLVLTSNNAEAGRVSASTQQMLRNGRPTPPRWRWLLAAILGVLFAALPQAQIRIPNPSDIPAVPNIDVIGGSGNVLNTLAGAPAKEFFPSTTANGGPMYGVPPEMRAVDTPAYDATIARALKLLPRQPEKVTLVDANDTSGLLYELQHVEAFVMRGERVVYLVTQGVTLRKALKGAGVFDYVLATVIWHEMAHIDGGDETKARLEEEQLWEQFIVGRRVDSVRGLRYLALLKKRR
jgi:hypothetical protein